MKNNSIKKKKASLSPDLLVGKSLRKYFILKLQITSAMLLFLCSHVFSYILVNFCLTTSENLNFHRHENHKIWNLPHIASFEWSISVKCSTYHHHCCAFHIILADGLSWTQFKINFILKWLLTLLIMSEGFYADRQYEWIFLFRPFIQDGSIIMPINIILPYIIVWTSDTVPF